MFPEKEFGKRSEARNRLLADLLSRTNYMEKAGTGIKRVLDSCKENGNKIKFSFSDAVWLTIETNSVDTDNDTDKRAEIIINSISKNNKISTKQLANNCSVSLSTIKREIEKLKLQNRLKRVGSEKTGHWVIIMNE